MSAEPHCLAAFCLISPSGETVTFSLVVCLPQYSDDRGQSSHVCFQRLEPSIIVHVAFHVKWPSIIELHVEFQMKWKHFSGSDAWFVMFMLSISCHFSKWTHGTFRFVTILLFLLSHTDMHHYVPLNCLIGHQWNFLHILNPLKPLCSTILSFGMLVVESIKLPPHCHAFKNKQKNKTKKKSLHLDASQLKSSNLCTVECISLLLKGKKVCILSFC